MAMTIMNDASVAMSLGELNKNISTLGKQLKKVSSGQRINGAGDDASGYAITVRLRVLENAYGQDIRNTQNGSKLIAVAEGGIQSILTNLRTIRELTLNARNDTNTDADRATIQKEIDGCLATIDDVASTTTYNGRILLNGDYFSPSREQYVFRTLAEEYGGTRTLDPARIVNSTPNGTVYANTLTNLFDAGLSDPGNSSITSPTTLIGCDSNNENIRKDREWAIGLDGFTVGSQGSGNINRVTLDFSAAQINGQPATVADFDGQGLTMMCQYSGQCAEFVSIRFDASQPIGSGLLLHDPDDFYDGEGNPLYDENGNSANPYYEHHEYVIGIGGATTVSDIPRAVYEGIKSITDNFNTWASLQTGNDNLGVGIENIAFASMDDVHNVQISKTADGKYVLSQDTWAMWIYDGIKTDDTGIDIPYSSSRQNVDGIRGNPLVIHTGPKANQALNVYINDMHIKSLRIDGLRVDDNRIADKTEPMTMNKFAQMLLDIDNAIGYTLNEMTRMGAYRQRLEHTENNLVTAQETTVNSASTMADADMAKEMTEYTKANVLAQASQSMLAQANQNSSQVMSLLQ
ncbi:MAG: flagellin [Schwartzia sp.]|nr:flagellin [Schwartzia sp. (in: firmicutes)]